MWLDDETATQLYHVFKSKGHVISLRTNLRCRAALSWTFRGSSYCQLIQLPNKVKQFQWAKNNEDDLFKIVVWTDESRFS